MFGKRSLFILEISKDALGTLGLSSAAALLVRALGKVGLDLPGLLTQIAAAFPCSLNSLCQCSISLVSNLGDPP
ncbi:MAG: hypothetical protein OEX97_02715, partial [Acidimicrobiia bacterium]|nr:hypothetical protein [Acidimicrobiia bacterium]